LTADERPPIIAVTDRAPKSRVEALGRAGAEVWVGPAAEGKVDLRALLQWLGERQVQSVLLEGGGTLAAGALAAGLVDRVYFFIAPSIIGGEGARTPVEGNGVVRLAEAWRLQNVTVRRVGEDLLISGEMAE
jgi:diaminohydroxyphosphoribosylaminopyrimidine deaminase/5-amino-6-(5-phosphoribosylamino)uracil reductase